MASSSKQAPDDALMRRKVKTLIAKVQALADFDLWLALSLAKSDMIKIPSLLVPLGYEAQEFDAIVKFGNMWPGYGHSLRTKWSSLFKKSFGINHITTRLHYGVVCVNFHPQATGCPLDVINGGGQRLMFVTRQLRASTLKYLELENIQDEEEGICEANSSQATPDAILGRCSNYNSQACDILNEVKGASDYVLHKSVHAHTFSEVKDTIYSILDKIEVKGSLDYILDTMEEDMEEDVISESCQQLNITDIKLRLSSGGGMTIKEKTDLSDLLSC